MRARVEYDGTDFAGFQLQLRARTVQGELEAALGTLSGGRRVRVDAAGRTDAGVHATGQVIAFSWPGRLTVKELGRALDALLPADVAVRGLRRAPLGFRPRYAARYREYRYTVWNGPRSPLRERTALRSLDHKLEVVSVPSIEEAARSALDHAHKGDRVLFSPGFAAGGLDSSRLERGERFVRAVRAL